MNRLRQWLLQFELGARRPLFVRRETIPGLGLGKRILFASDLHLKKHGPPHILEGLAQIAASQSPDLILLGGDLVDSRRALDTLQSLVRKFVHIAPLGAVSGNHDHWIGLSKVRAAVLDAGGRWLEDAPWLLNPDCAIYGSITQPTQPAKHHLLCAHYPASTAQHHFHLTLSGHLHGGQFVFYERRGKLYPGAFLYPWNGLRFQDQHGKTLLISRGVQDTLPLRWNCPREVLLIDI